MESNLGARGLVRQLHLIHALAAVLLTPWTVVLIVVVTFLSWSQFPVALIIEFRVRRIPVLLQDFLIESWWGL